MGRVVEERAASLEPERRRAPRPEQPPLSRQQRVLALQRNAGNQAAVRLLARKVKDIAVGADLPQPIADAVRRYNATSAIGSIDKPDEREKRRKGDAILLNAILDQLYEKEQRSASEDKLLETVNEHHAALLEENRKGVVSGAAALPADGPIVFSSGFPTGLLKQPPVVGAAMFAVEHIDITINNRPYRLFAGQDYLNPGKSRDYQNGTEPIAAGDTIIHARPAQDGGNYEEAMVGDAHHRFVWGAYFGRPITATFRRGWGTKSEKWNALRYKRDPKNEYEYNETSPTVDEVFVAVVSELPDLAGRFGSADQAERQFLLECLRIVRKNRELKAEDGELNKLASLLRGMVAKSKASPFDVMVEHLVQTSKRKAHAEAMARMMLESFPSGTLPVVALNRAFSKGFYSARTHVIVLDPDKNDGSDGLLDTLAFESGNALRRDDFLANAVLATQIEFDVTDRYLAMLLEATRSGGINSLVVALELPEQFLILADAPESLKAKKLVTAGKKPAMPTPSVLPEQYKRTALAAFMQQEWSEGDRQKYFAISTHSVEDEMEATGEGYEVGPKGASVVSAVSGGGAARPASFTALVLAMVDEYPRATSAHFTGLEPRHYGEFLLTGRVDKWHSVAPQEAPHVRQDLMLKVHRDLEQVYPNTSAWEPRLRDISLADLGEFVLNGKIRSWESH